VTVHIETISGFARTFPIYDREFWRGYPHAHAAELAMLLALAKRGRRIDPFTAPAGGERQKAERDYQLAELTRSIRHCREVLGLGVRPVAA
jgi:hypothetical protein